MGPIPTVNPPVGAGLRRRGRPASPRRGLVLLLIVVASSMALTACATGSSSGGRSSDRVVEVVAAENFWGSIAAQVGGSHAQVVSIITNPNTDPHAYEPTAADARTLAGAQLVIENGIGYDPWVPKLLAADQANQSVLDVGTLLGVPDGSNPHRWYDPGDVESVIAQLVRDYGILDPRDASYFDQRARRFDTVDLAGYHTTIATIRARYAGTPVGASESIFAMLAPSLGLDLITPPTFLRAISEGTDVTVADRETIDHQIQDHLIRIYVYNSQNVTPDVQAQLRQVKAEHIPFATITETLQPAGATFQAWQTGQLAGIEAALAEAARVPS